MKCTDYEKSKKNNIFVKQNSYAKKNREKFMVISKRLLHKVGHPHTLY